MSLCEVEQILDKKYNILKRQNQYLIKWANYSKQQSTWQPQQNLQNVADMINQFQNDLKQNQSHESMRNPVDETSLIYHSDSQNFKKLRNSERLLGLFQVAIQGLVNEKTKKIIKRDQANRLKKTDHFQRKLEKKQYKLFNNKLITEIDKTSQVECIWQQQEENKIIQLVDKIQPQALHQNSLADQQLLKVVQRQKVISNFHVLEMAKAKSGFIYLVKEKGESKWMSKKDLMRYNKEALIDFYERHLVISSNDKMKND